MEVSNIQAPFEGACVSEIHATIAEMYRCMLTGISCSPVPIFDLEHGLHESRMPHHVTCILEAESSLIAQADMCLNVQTQVS